MIQFSGHKDTYSVDSHINITCSATDGLSGIASKECPNVEGPAYEFEIGINKVTASATDKASNTGEVEIQFTVTVDFDSLSRLTEAFITKKGVADSLVSKLQSANASAAKGNHEAKVGQLKAYENQLKAQSGKAVTEQKRDLLISLVNILKN